MSATDTDFSTVPDRHVPASQQERVNRILNHATFCGIQPDGEGGHLELWTLLKAIPGHPKNSTITRTTLEQALFHSSP